LNWFENLRIGYVPYGPTFEFPADRRRFCYYARERNIPFEIAQPSEVYDVVVLSQAADISVWSQYPRGRTKVVFDFVDSYLSIPKRDLKGMLRGLAKFASGQNRRLRLNYRTALEDMCRRADATVCGTAEQRATILPFCPNVHVILDSQSIAVRGWKEDYRAGDVFHFAWEGLAHNLWHLLEIKEALQDLRRKRPFLIHVVTEMRYGRFLGRQFGKRSTIDDASKIWPGICLYTWHESTFPAIVRSCDLALIPIPLKDPFCAGKPENRLLLFWRMGMPVLASGTPAHNRAFQEAGLGTGLTSPQEWREALDEYMSNEQARKRAGQSGRTFAETFHSNDKWLTRWDEVFRSILQ
jgi:glycosyltransferase involved in cell wall biosynthesis